mgnify:FL=1
MITVEVEMTEEQAAAFAQFLKRVGVSDYRNLSVDDDEAYAMQEAGEKIRRALGEVGYTPR